MIAALLALALAGPATVADLAWMSGRWESVSGGRWTEEQWSEPRGGVMLGFSRSGSGDALHEWEQIRLAPGEGGVPTYFASPGGRTPVAFRLVRSEATSATFENPDHDFPQRIRYVRTGDTMAATISAIDGSDAVSWTFRRRPEAAEIAWPRTRRSRPRRMWMPSSKRSRIRSGARMRSGCAR